MRPLKLHAGQPKRVGWEKKARQVRSRRNIGTRFRLGILFRKGIISRPPGNTVLTSSLLFFRIDPRGVELQRPGAMPTHPKPAWRTSIRPRRSISGPAPYAWRRLVVSSMVPTLLGAARGLFRVKLATHLGRYTRLIGDAVRTRRRLAASAIAAIVGGAVLVGLLFYATRSAHQFGAVSRNAIERISKFDNLSSTPQSQSAEVLPHDQEPLHRPVEPTLEGTQGAQRRADDLANVTADPQRSLQQERERAEALARDLAAARRKLEASTALLNEMDAEAARAKQSAESAAAELRQLLQQERDRAEALARELAEARHEVEASAAQTRIPSVGEFFFGAADSGPTPKTSRRSFFGAADSGPTPSIVFDCRVSSSCTSKTISLRTSTIR